ncbi:MAG: 2-succinyl-5-enolpyruvyl-6-hydroxy-3-cyclohexene-1-carboxylic-acid synthase, partial [Flavobacteriaceae bacterium]|nr:2-succinyl-5-enolpyruvyl-6-hydroxy-3-cyclohexene-1-carboxylic-acid synthase [Flavobacteriaceae bacterium]
MTLPKIPLAQAIIKHAELHGLRHVVISPGSRNAPLTIGFTGHDYFSCYSIVDERSAAFFALGLAQQTQNPVILVCTSGSALLNYFPAIAEAYYSHIPLIVLSADRPKHLIGIGDGQTIDQKGVFGSHVLMSTNLKEDIDPEQEEKDDDPMILKAIENRLERFIGIQKSIQEQNNAAIQKTFRKAINYSGPVHLNVPFAEPLYETVDSFNVKIESPPVEEETILINDELIFNLADDWNSSQKKMVLIGTANPGYIDQKWLDELANDQSVIVFTETNSNVNQPEFFPSIDKIIAPLDDEGFKELQPEILITLGGMIVSKKIKAFLREYQPRQHWHVGEHPALDTYFCLNAHVDSHPNDFFERFLSYVRVNKSSYKPKWKLIKAHRARMHEKYISGLEFTDLKVFDHILQRLPENIVLQ